MSTFNKLAKLYASTHLHDPSWPGLNAPPDQANGLPYWDTPETAIDPDDLEDIQMSASGEWTPYQGPRGGHGWKSARTGRIVYGQRPGDLDHDGPDHDEPEPEATPEIGDRPSAIRHLLGTAASKAVSSRSVMKRIGRAAWDKLPPKAQASCTRLYKLAKAVEHYAMFSYHKGNELAVEVAKQRGLGMEHAQRVGRMLGAADLAVGWTVAFPAVTAVTGNPILGKMSAYLPLASLAYIAGSTVRNPFAAMRAARQLAYEGVRGVARMSREGLDINDFAADLYEQLQQTDRPDRFEAVFTAALDRTKDVRKALKIAGSAGEKRLSAPGDYQLVPDGPVDAVVPAEPLSTHGKVQKLLESAAGFPRMAIDHAAQIVSLKLAALEARYSRRGAAMILGASLALAPMQAPGTSIIPVALAEAFMRSQRFSHLSLALPDMTVEELVPAVQAFIREVHHDLGQPVPLVSDDEIRRTLAEMQRPDVLLARADDEAAEEEDFYQFGRSVASAPKPKQEEPAAVPEPEEQVPPPEPAVELSLPAVPIAPVAPPVPVQPLTIQVNMPRGKTKTTITPEYFPDGRIKSVTRTEDEEEAGDAK